MQNVKAIKKNEIKTQNCKDKGYPANKSVSLNQTQQNFSTLSLQVYTQELDKLL